MLTRLTPLLALAAVAARAPAADPPAGPDPLAWPAVAAEHRPWTRWWWLGSAVDKENLTRSLEEFRQAGIGGVEICPIYGAKGAEDRFLEFLSPEWVRMLAHTTAEGKRLGLGVDMTTGTGWPFGGPTVTDDDASARAVFQTFAVAGGEKLSARLPKGKTRAAVAVSADGKRVDLTAEVKDGRVEWAAPPGAWKVYAVVQQSPVMKVKRAAPGGVGNVLDPYSPAKLGRYLAGFDKALAGFAAPPPRAWFHDSFEYYQASWTDDLFDVFRKRRGYDLRTQLPALAGDGPADTVARVKCDYRETLSDLHREYLGRWTAWCHTHGGLSRNQAHGGPGNILDAYAAADIPECEIYAEYRDSHRPFLKMASSAAHLTGRNLVSAESFTWLGEHFQAPLSKAKPAADYLFLAGVNHVFFHGIPYSPKDAPWPGWQFYAAVNFGPGGGLWRDLPAFNAYLTRCQSVLQAGRPANDVLLYVPFHDVWQSPDGLVTTFAMPGSWMEPHPVHAAAMTLENRGYAYDEVSDRLLADAKVEGGAVRLGGSPYRAVVVPPCRVIPAATVRKLIELARGGATVIFLGGLPADVPGFGDLEKRRAELREALKGISPPETKVGAGRVFVGEDVDGLLRSAGVPHEPAAEAGIRFVRRTHPGGHHYFLVNGGDKPVDGWVALGTPARSAVLLDPLAADRAGGAAVRRGPNRTAEVYLQLRPGESRILRTFMHEGVDVRPWRYTQPAGEPVALTGTWKVEFVEGGPVLPARFETKELASWTARDDPEAKRFAGTARYTVAFDRPPGDAADWVLDLGDVRESARVAVNGQPAGTLFCPPFRVPIGRLLKPGRNTLTVEVTNLAANRVADLDRRKVDWKYFYDANLANHPSTRKRGVLDASGWPPVESGLLGPVRLIPVAELDPKQE